MGAMAVLAGFSRATGGRYGDHRNWPAIDAWADLIALQLDVKSSRDLRAW
jgi:hypothetical protein